MDGHVLKPIRAAALFAEIDKVTCIAGGESQDVERTSTDATAEPRGEAPLTSVFDEAELLSHVGQDAGFLAELVELFQVDSRDLFGKLREALARQDGVGLTRAAHTFKGMVGNFCAPAAAQAALDLELAAKQSAFDLASRHLATLETEVEKLDAGLLKLLEGLNHARVGR
jgi:HPt (histidine-containing phosphotransfer) domain-containing protein